MNLQVWGKKYNKIIKSSEKWFKNLNIKKNFKSKIHGRLKSTSQIFKYLKITSIETLFAEMF